MRKTLLLALLAIAFLAMPAMASVQNVKVGGQINTMWMVRDQFDLGTVTRSDDFYQNFIMTHVRLRVDADLTDNVQATVALLNERAWDEDLNDIDGGVSQNEGANDVDLNLAYVTLREMLYSPLTVIVGRQLFAYGNSFVIDAAGTNNVLSTGGLKGVSEDMTSFRTAQDAIRLILDYNPLTIDLVASKIDANRLAGTGAQDDDVDLFGSNANYKIGDQWDSVVEGYFWAKIDQSTKVNSAGQTGHYKADTVYVPGIRVSSNPIKGLNVSVEGALQRGNITQTETASAAAENQKREAAGAQVITNYVLPFEKTAKWSPVFTGVYTYVSGDNDNNDIRRDAIPLYPVDRTYEGWDPMFENQGGGSIYNTLFDLTNVHIYIAKAQLKPIEDVTAWASWTGMWIDKEIAGARDAFVGDCTGTTAAGCFSMRQPDGTVITPRVTTNKSVGNEFGIGMLYDYTEDVQIGARADWFRPGGMFHDDNEDVASQYVVNANVNF